MNLDDVDLMNLELFLNGDPHEAWRVLRREAPVFWHNKQPERAFWAVTRYEDALRIYHDPASFSSARGVSIGMIGIPGDQPTGMGQMMLMCDPPRHGQMRSLINRRLTRARSFLTSRTSGASRPK